MLENLKSNIYICVYIYIYKIYTVTFNLGCGKRGGIKKDKEAERKQDII